MQPSPCSGQESSRGMVRKPRHPMIMSLQLSYWGITAESTEKYTITIKGSYMQEWMDKSATPRHILNIISLAYPNTHTRTFLSHSVPRSFQLYWHTWLSHLLNSTAENQFNWQYFVHYKAPQQSVSQSEDCDEHAYRSWKRFRNSASLLL